VIFLGKLINLNVGDKREVKRKEFTYKNIDVGFEFVWDKYDMCHGPQREGLSTHRSFHIILQLPTK